MGVPHLWEVLRKAGKSRSIVDIAVTEGYEVNRTKYRAYRVGIDALIWFKHAEHASTAKGENGDLLTLFWRLAKLAKLPVIPLFVFDGRQRPRVKRNSRMGKSGTHPLTAPFKKLLNAFGMQCHDALSEAEAELAFLNTEGLIDAVMTDDCDAFLFGAKTILRNLGNSTAGNKANPATNQNGKTDEYHAMFYDAEALKITEGVGMTRGGMILFALLCGGDYDTKGLQGFGPAIAHALARCGFGDDLLKACQTIKSDQLRIYLTGWMHRVNDELANNRRGFIKHRTSLVLPAHFPNIDILQSYANPLTSACDPNIPRINDLTIRDQDPLDLAAIASICEAKFEWGYRSKLLERFRATLWPGAVIQVLRRIALQTDIEGESRSTFDSNNGRSQRKGLGTPISLVEGYLAKDKAGTSSLEARFGHIFAPASSSSSHSQAYHIEAPQLIIRVSASREHVSTDGLLEYEAEVDAGQLVRLASRGIRDKVTDAQEAFRHLQNKAEAERTTPAKPTPKPDEPLRVWVPAAMLRVACPDLETAFLADGGKRKRKGKQKELPASEEPAPMAPPPVPRRASATTSRSRSTSIPSSSPPKPPPSSTPSTVSEAASEPKSRKRPRPSTTAATKKKRTAPANGWFPPDTKSPEFKSRQGFLFGFSNPQCDSDILNSDDEAEDTAPPIASGSTNTSSVVAWDLEMREGQFEAIPDLDLTTAATSSSSRPRKRRRQMRDLPVDIDLTI